MAAIVDRYFPSAEAAAWHALPVARQAADFFLLWSAREAAIKCAGLGLAKGLGVTRIDPDLLEHAHATGRVGNQVVHLQRLEAPAGYVLVLGFGGWAGKGD
jgi:phosphopantetheinyl transferase